MRNRPSGSPLVQLTSTILPLLRATPHAHTLYMMNTEIIATFENKEEGTCAYVAKVQGGYSVAVKDTDADEFYPVAIIYPTVDRAIAKAKEVL